MYTLSSYKRRGLIIASTSLKTYAIGKWSAGPSGQRNCLATAYISPSASQIGAVQSGGGVPGGAAAQQVCDGDFGASPSHIAQHAKIAHTGYG